MGGPSEETGAGSFLDLFRERSDRGEDGGVFAAELAQLLGTICLEASLDLSAHPEVRGSILNYGLPDFSHLASSESATARVVAEIAQALRRHEPRIEGSGIMVKPLRQDAEVTRQLAFLVSGQLRTRPFARPLALTAEIDVGLGKVMMADLEIGR